MIAAALAAAEEHTRAQRWAIVAASHLRDGGLVDLLTAQLSPDKSFQLVERADVARAMEELSLKASGLRNPEQAMKFGRIVAADAA
jgi:hypothetical protein